MKFNMILVFGFFLLQDGLLHLCFSQPPLPQTTGNNTIVANTTTEFGDHTTSQNTMLSEETQTIISMSNFTDSKNTDLLNSSWCSTNEGRWVANGVWYQPGADPCLTCICENGEPHLCATNSSSPLCKPTTTTTTTTTTTSPCCDYSFTIGTYLTPIIFFGLITIILGFNVSIIIHQRCKCKHTTHSSRHQSPPLPSLLPSHQERRNTSSSLPDYNRACSIYRVSYNSESERSEIGLQPSCDPPSYGDVMKERELNKTYD